MPRHGMTASGTAEPVGGAAPGRRFGLSSWPIRRKLVALVAGPLLVILGAGALVTTQAIGQLREAQDAEKIATAALYSNQLAQALQREVISTMTVVAEPSKGTRIRLRKDRATTDAAFATLNSELSDAPRGGWDVLTKSKIKDIADRRQALAQIRQETFPHGIEESGIKQPARRAGGAPAAPRAGGLPERVRGASGAHRAPRPAALHRHLGRQHGQHGIHHHRARGCLDPRGQRDHRRRHRPRQRKPARAGQGRGCAVGEPAAGPPAHRREPRDRGPAVLHRRRQRGRRAHRRVPQRGARPRQQRG